MGRMPQKSTTAMPSLPPGTPVFTGPVPQMAARIDLMEYDEEHIVDLEGVSVDDAKHIAERLVRTASDAYIMQGQEIERSASVGIALVPQHGEELWHLVSIADGAMYQAKSIPEEEAANDRAAYVDAATAS